MSSEAQTRWYSRDTFEIVNEVQKANKKGMTKVTITHARKLGFLPSVTSVTKGAYTQGHNLIDWMIKQAIMAASEVPFVGDRGDPVLVKDHIAFVKAKANEFRDATADRGTELHGVVDKWIESDCTYTTPDPAGTRMIEELDEFIIEHKIRNIHCEKPVGSVELGWAGTPDLYCETDDAPILLDLKTTNLDKYTGAYDTQKMQLGAYDLLLGGNARLFNWVADRETGNSKFIEHEDPQRWRDAFSHVFEVWCLTNAKKPYDPRTYGAVA